VASATALFFARGKDTFDSSQYYIWPWMDMGGRGYEGGVLSGRMHSHNGLAGYDEIPRKVLNDLEKRAGIHCFSP
jgi:hypothetical protein